LNEQSGFNQVVNPNCCLEINGEMPEIPVSLEKVEWQCDVIVRAQGKDSPWA